MVQRKGFTLAELVIATLIFGFMITSLATIYATANKHMFQQYRQNSVKSAASVAMKDMVNNLMTANRVDYPAYNAADTRLAFAVNVDQNSGCYPVNTAQAVTWHYFCLSGRTLYHHFGTVTGGAGCPAPPPVPCTSAGCFTIASYPAFCGPGGGGLVTQLSNMVSLDPYTSAIFTRKGTTSTYDKVYEEDQVKIVLRLFWDPQSLTTSGAVNTVGRVVNTTLISTVKVNRSVN